MRKLLLALGLAAALQVGSLLADGAQISGLTTAKTAFAQTEGSCGVGKEFSEFARKKKKGPGASEAGQSSTAKCAGQG